MWRLGIVLGFSGIVLMNGGSAISANRLGAVVLIFAPISCCARPTLVIASCSM